jgi:hypothetical protein
MGVAAVVFSRGARVARVGRRARGARLTAAGTSPPDVAQVPASHWSGNA